MEVTAGFYMNFLWSVTFAMVFYDLHGIHGISMEYHQIHHVGFMGHVCMALYPIWMVTTHETLKLETETLASPDDTRRLSKQA